MSNIKIAVVLVVLGSVPVSAQERDFLELHSHRDAADKVSTSLVAFNITMESIHAFRQENRTAALACLGMRNAIGTAIAESVKRIVHRDRPDGSDNKSFFSEHTMDAAINSGWKYSISIPIVIGTGSGRMMAGKHFGSDVLTGAAVGFLVRKVCKDQ